MLFKEVPLSEPRLLALSRGGDSFTLQRVANAINKGAAQLFETDNGSLIALSVDGEDLVVWAMTGYDAPAVVTELKRLAAHMGCLFVRFVTQKKGLPRLLKMHKPIDFGTIYRIRVDESNH